MNSILNDLEIRILFDIFVFSVKKMLFSVIFWVSVFYLISVIFLHFLFCGKTCHSRLLSFGGDKKMERGAHWLMVKKKRDPWVTLG